MRPHNLRLLQSRAEQITEEDLNGHTMAFWVKNFGATAAGWLIWEMRKSFIRAGVVLFKIQKSAATPPWFRVAIATLQDRRHWSVTTQSTKLERNYVVQWLGWRKGVFDPMEERQPSHGLKLIKGGG